MEKSNEKLDQSPPKRAYTSYTPKWQRFDLTSDSKLNPKTSSTAIATSHQNHAYARQYSHVYSRRLEILRARCIESASGNSESKGEKAEVVPRIIELKEGVVSIVVGTLIKNSPGRPGVDTDYHSTDVYSDGFSANDNTMTMEPLRTYANGEKDTLVLEDESGRVELLSQEATDTLHAHNIVTGMVVAVSGAVQANTGAMVVNQFHFATLPPQTHVTNKSNSPSPYVMLVSGLNCGGVSKCDAQHDSSLSLRRAMLSDYIAGHMEQKDDAVRISRLVIAGGGCARPRSNNIDSSGTSFASKSNNKNAINPFIQSITSAVQELDLFVSEICSSGVPVDLIPGLHDPTNANFPQQPLHSCLLPYSSSFNEGLFHRTTNPYEVELDKVVILGSDGRNVADILRYTYNPTDELSESTDNTQGDENKEDAKVETTKLSSLQALEQTLLCSHLAPTAPDSLNCFPYYDNDPFVMEECPHIYFAGNCSKFETKLIEKNESGGSSKCRLICVPSFAETGEVVLVNLDTLDCECVSFIDHYDGDNGGKIEE